MRVRRPVSAKWIHATNRAYLYAGLAKGATVAAWKQAARAELTTTQRGISFGQVLLDLVKAYDHVPHHLLVQEAIALGYPLWILRLTLAAYRAARVIRLDGAISSLIAPLCGITAGSGLADSEMRLMLVRIVDSICLKFRAVVPTLYVDDLALEMVGTADIILRDLGDATIKTCTSMALKLLEVSRKKSVCTASSPSLGYHFAARLRHFGIKFAYRVKSPGLAWVRA